MFLQIKRYLPSITLGTLLLAGLVFRLKGISTNHSFWSDEAYVSGIAKDIFLGKTSLSQGLSALRYQFFQIITVLGSFSLFGISEWAARLPSVLWGTAGIATSYLVAKKFSNHGGGLLAAFLYTFLQLNLANSTQAKPYAAIQTLYLLTIYGSLTLSETVKMKQKLLIHAVILAGASIAIFYHPLGIICLVFYLTYTLPGFYSWLKKLPTIYIFSLVLGLTFIAFYLFDLGVIISLFFRPTVNNFTYLREFFWRQYAFLTLPAIFGLALIKDKKSILSLALSTLPVLIMWLFFQESKNLRYLLPLIGLLIVKFGIFWTKVSFSLYKGSAVVCLFVALLIYAGGYKVVRKPAVYYTPNADFFADVQNADYKVFYKKIYEQFPDFDNIPYFTNGFDHGSWYTFHLPSAIFMKTNLPPFQHDYYSVMIYPSQEYFLQEQEKYPRGLVIIEDWQSLMPDDVKGYIKKNLKLEFRVESMAVAQEEKWPLELYSWGFDEKKSK